MARSFNRWWRNSRCWRKCSVTDPAASPSSEEPLDAIPVDAVPVDAIDMRSGDAADTMGVDTNRWPSPSAYPFGMAPPLPYPPPARPRIWTALVAGVLSIPFALLLSIIAMMVVMFLDFGIPTAGNARGLQAWFEN